ncbi:M56 family metallopeptidase [Nocardioides sp. Bht2]|uniref:M56 family metallopeptidase n=1 Tax=Nocardioides sp. Bht2 TaxID=3392297 RepID=UPI0039B62C63
MTPILLAGLAIALAGPVPALLARVPQLRRTPLAAMLLWQAIAAAGVLAAIGAGLALFTQHGAINAWLGLAALALTVLVAGRMLLSAHRVGTSLRAVRRRHREQLDLVGERSGHLRVIEHDLPVAYCVPGFGQNRIVVSAGAQGVLTDEEFGAVLAHERSHLRARHDLVLEAFSALREAFPAWVSSAAAMREVQLLVEVIADRSAVRHSGSLPLGRALVALAEGRAPQAALGVGGSHLLARVELLAEDRPRRVQAATLLTAAVAVLLLPTAFIVVPWLAAVV